jgi:16S rRNA (uracil1498-N3)-methyltransferase
MPVFPKKRGMLRAYCSEWDGGDTLPELDRDELHHLIRVRRVRPGERIEVLNGLGAIGTARVEEVGSKHLDWQIEGIEQAKAPGLSRHLLVALPKGKTFPALLQKMTELGVSEITPLLTDNSEVPPERAGRKSDRWETVLIEAVKQSGNPWLPKLNAPISLTDALSAENATWRICAALQADALPLRDVLLDRPLETGMVEVYVGPEGDFSDREYALLRERGCQFVSLGSIVLRVETAASLVMGTLGIW